MGELGCLFEFSFGSYLNISVFVDYFHLRWVQSPLNRVNKEKKLNFSNGGESTLRWKPTRNVFLNANFWVALLFNKLPVMPLT